MKTRMDTAMEGWRSGPVGRRVCGPHKRLWTCTFELSRLTSHKIEVNTMNFRSEQALEFPGALKITQVWGKDCLPIVSSESFCPERSSSPADSFYKSRLISALSMRFFSDIQFLVNSAGPPPQTETIPVEF